MADLLKFPRTPHLEGSRLQPGDEDLDAIPFSGIEGLYIVAEEKVDGGNCGISFSAAGDLLLQSRGHYLTGGAREAQFAPLKAWANRHHAMLRDLLEDRYVMYAEWVYAKHTIFYDALPHYFLEFDLLDRMTGVFLSTARRRERLAGLPVCSVPVLFEGPAASLKSLTSLIGHSTFKSPDWASALREQAVETDQDPERVLSETDGRSEMEGLYIKVEDGERVIARCKYVRASFLDTVRSSRSHWMDRPILPNRLAPGVDIYKDID